MSMVLLALLAPSVPAQRIHRGGPQIVDCNGLADLKEPIKRNLQPNVKCRLEVTDLKCMPGLKLRVDAHGPEDLCLAKDLRPVSSPFCKARSMKLYRQSVIKRGRFLVERPPQPVGIELLEIPITTTGLREVLAQERPIRQIGPDACVYLRQSRKVLILPSGRSKAKATAPVPKPAKP
jgi:hypothetical protein